MFCFKSLIGSLICVSATALAQNSYSENTNNTCPDGRKHYRATVRHIEKGGIGYSDGYTTLETFLAPDPSKWAVTPFLDVRGHVFNNGRWAANAGVGLRGLWGNRVYGINTYYDYRNTNRFHSNQIGAGLETLGQILDFRINGYLPVGKKITSPYDTSFANFAGHNLLISQKYKSAMKGSDAEFGFHFGKSKSFDFYAAAGPYYFIGEKIQATWGGKARLSGTFKDILTLEISDSYDRTFHNKFQGQISLNFAFGPKSRVKKNGRTCQVANTLNDRMLQPVGRQEIIVFDKTKKKSVAIDPTTDKPYFFVFVDNTSSSAGTYESPYPTFAQAQDNSSPNNIIYVFPGDGTTRGMDSGIALKDNQKLWGSSLSYSVPTSQGTISIPAFSSVAPTITNTNINTEGNAITLAAHNTISGINVSSAFNDAIYGIDIQSLELSYCKIENTTTYVLEASFPNDASVSVTNNQFLNNVNGVLLTLNGTSTVDCSDNTFKGQSSISSFPISILSGSNTLTAHIENNLFDQNTTGSIQFNFLDVNQATILVKNNILTNNTAGAFSTLGSNVVIIPNGTNEHCSLVLEENTFSGNETNSLYFHTSGQFTNLEVTASKNVMSDNGGGLVFATPTDNLTVVATENTMSGINNNGIAVIGMLSSLTGNITITNNLIEGIGNTSNGIAISQDFTTLNLNVLNNEINNCEGSGILAYTPGGIDSLIMNVSDNNISNCQNGSGNAASAISLDTYLNLTATLANNTFSDNISPSVGIGVFSAGDPNVCLTFTNNISNVDPAYSFTNPGMGAFNLSPCDVESVNIGMITTSGTITPVISCPDAVPCPP